MANKFIFLAEGEADRAATVGWIVLAIAIGAGILLAIVFTALASGNILDRLARYLPPYSGLWFALVASGLALLGLAYIVASQGIGILGGIVLILVWRISDRHVG